MTTTISIYLTIIRKYEKTKKRGKEKKNGATVSHGGLRQYNLYTIYQYNLSLHKTIEMITST